MFVLEPSGKPVDFVDVDPSFSAVLRLAEPVAVGVPKIAAARDAPAVMSKVSTALASKLLNTTHHRNRIDAGTAAE
jgi:hypothetical protein